MFYIILIAFSSWVWICWLLSHPVVLYIILIAFLSWVQICWLLIYHSDQTVELSSSLLIVNSSRHVIYHFDWMFGLSSNLLIAESSRDDSKHIFKLILKCYFWLSVIQLNSNNQLLWVTLSHTFSKLMLKKWCQPSHISTELSYTISSFLLSMTFLWLLRSLQLSSNFILLLTLILFLSTTPVSIVFSLSSHFHVSPISSYHLQCHHPLTILFLPLLNHFLSPKH